MCKWYMCAACCGVSVYLGCACRICVLCVSICGCGVGMVCVVGVVCSVRGV